MKASTQSSFGLVESSAQSKTIRKSAIATKLQEIWQSIFLFFTSQPEPRIQQVSNRNGDLHWLVFDPVTGDRQYFSSVAEVRTWLEQRYSGKRYS
jgi:hypothetical protein